MLSRLESRLCASYDRLRANLVIHNLWNRNLRVRDLSDIARLSAPRGQLLSTMPLIIVTGLPCSGKSTFSRALSEYIQKRLSDDSDKRKVRIVTDEVSLDWDGRDAIYGSIAKEKDLRSSLRSEAGRYLHLDQFVILDAAAYIKGYRYELHCMAKEAKTQYCMVELLLDTDLCWNRNQRLQADKGVSYQRSTFDALLTRYEKCDSNNRWDSPLVRVSEERMATDPCTFEEIYKFVTEDKPQVPNKSTTKLMSTTTIYKPKQP